MTEKIDPLSQRILNVFTKSDFVNRSDEKHVINLMREIKNKLNLNYCMIRNRNQQKKFLSIIDRHEKKK